MNFQSILCLLIFDSSYGNIFREKFESTMILWDHLYLKLYGIS